MLENKKIKQELDVKNKNNQDLKTRINQLELNIQNKEM